MHDEMQPLDTNLPPSTPGPENVDHEGAMAKADLFKLANYSVKLFKKIDDNDQLESWVQAKITKAADYVASVYHYLEYEMKFSEFGSKLENSEMYTESEKKELKNKLMEAKEKVKELKKLQADKMSGKKTVKVKESWDEDDDDDDDDVKKADSELKKMGKKPIKAHAKADPDKDISKLAKKSKKDDDDLDESWDDDEDDDVKKADSELKKMGKKPIKAHAKADPDKDISKLAKKSKKDDDDLDESKRTVKEAVKKAKKDYDGDGEIESEKDEVWGSRMKAANKSKKVSEAAKPDFLDLDKDGNKKEPMKKAAKASGAKNSKAAVAMQKNTKRETMKESFGLSGEKMPKMKRNDPHNQFTGDRPDIVLPYQDDWDLAEKQVITALRKKGIRVDGTDHEASPVIIFLKHGKQVAWFDLENSYGYITSEYPGPIDEVSDEENDVISAPQPAPQPEPNPEENDVISAPMNESRELDRIKMLSGL